MGKCSMIRDQLCYKARTFSFLRKLPSYCLPKKIEFAEIIKDLVGGNSKIVHMPGVQDDPQRRKPDITRARTILNWEPTVALNVGLQKTVNYFQEELRKFRHSQRTKHNPT